MSTNEPITLASLFIMMYVGGFMYLFGRMGNIMNILAFCYLNLHISAFLAASSISGQIYITFAIFLHSWL
jgi:hypothetical protein